MAAVTSLPWGRPLTRADVRELPDDGHRYELLDGMLLVSPSPTHRHQRAVTRLGLLLGNACPSDQELLVAPFDVVLADDTVLQPDLLVADVCDLADARVPLAPHLVVEVLSPSTRRVDLLLKRSRYEAAGVPAYWSWTRRSPRSPSSSSSSFATSRPPASWTPRRSRSSTPTRSPSSLGRWSSEAGEDAGPRLRRVTALPPLRGLRGDHRERTLESRAGAAGGAARCARVRDARTWRGRP
jgi:Uma2 family endonuclease